jgi:hypothetical protein
MKHIPGEADSSRLRHEEVQAMTAALINLAETQVIATRLINRLGGRRLGRFWRSLISAMVVGIALAIIQLSAWLLSCAGWRDALSHWGTFLLIACLIVYSIEIVDYLHKAYLGQTVLELLSASATRKIGSQYEDWFRRLFSPEWQRWCVCVGGALGAAALLAFSWSTTLHEQVASVIFGLALGSAGFHGVSFGIRIPMLAWLVGRQSMQLYSFRPGDTPWMKTLSEMFSAMCAGLFVGTALCFLGSGFLIPQHSLLERKVWMFCLVTAGLVILFSFVAPQWKLTTMIRNKKQCDCRLILAALQEARAQLFSRAGYVEDQTLTKRLSDAYEGVSKSPNTPIDAVQLVKVGSALVGYFSSAYKHWPDVQRAAHWLITQL